MAEATQTNSVENLFEAMRPHLKHKPVWDGIKRIHHGKADINDRRTTFASLLAHLFRFEKHGNNQFVPWRNFVLQYLTALCAESQP